MGKRNTLSANIYGSVLINKFTQNITYLSDELRRDDRTAMQSNRGNLITIQVHLAGTIESYGDKIMEKIKIISEISYTLKVIGGKWKPLILEFLEENGTQRYMDIYRYLGDAPKKTLTGQLRELEEDGVIERNVIPTVPVQVEYTLTEFGKTLSPVLYAMCDWGFWNMDRDRYELVHPVCEDEEQGTK